jgi:Resolvase, N terminal domain
MTAMSKRVQGAMTTYGYARVSTNGQDLSSQEAELLAAGCAKVFKEKVSGAKTDRAELAKLSARSRAAMCWLSLDWTGWHVRPAICST